MSEHSAASTAEHSATSTAGVKKRKTAPEQLNYLVDFISNNKIMLHGKTKPAEAGNKTIEKLWDELTVGLNSIGSGPKKTKAQWRKVFVDWKCHTKKKAREQYKEARKTGGGEINEGKKSLLLTPTEEKLMSVISWITVEGSDIGEVGLEMEAEGQEEEAVILEEGVLREEPVDREVNVNESTPQSSQKRHGDRFLATELKKKVNDKSTKLERAAEAYKVGQQCTAEIINKLIAAGTSNNNDEFKKRELDLKEEELRIRLLEAYNKTRELDLLEKK